MTPNYAVTVILGGHRLTEIQPANVRLCSESNAYRKF